MTVITAHSAVRYTHNPLMLYRWILLFMLGGFASTTYYLVMPRWAASSTALQLGW